MKKFLLLAAAAVLGSASIAQSDAEVVRFNGPITHLGTYHVATGTLTPPDLAAGADGSTICYSNGAFAGNVTTTPNTSNLGKEYVDWGTFSTCGAFGTNSMTKFTAGFVCGIANPVNPIFEVNFYGGTNNAVVGPPFGVKGTLIQSYTINLTGGFTQTTTALAAYTVDIDIAATPITIPNGAIGWSYRIPTAITGTAGTGFGWMLIPVASSAAGNVDYFDRYLASGAFEGSFQFTAAGGGSAGLASFYMRMTMDDNAPPCAGGVSIYGSGAGGINQGVLLASGTAKIGSLVAISCKNPQAPASSTTAFMYFSTATASFDPGLGGTVLILPPAFQQQSKKFPPVFDPSATFPQTIPNDISLDGLHVYGQALYLNTSSATPFRLTDGAVDIYINNCP